MHVFFAFINTLFSKQLQSMENHIYSINCKKFEYKITEKYIIKIKHWATDVTCSPFLVQYLCEFSREAEPCSKHFIANTAGTNPTVTVTVQMLF